MSAPPEKVESALYPGAPRPWLKTKRRSIAVAVVLVIGGSTATACSGTDEPAASKSSVPATPDATEESAAEPTPVEEGTSPASGQEDAARAAKHHLDFTPFSRNGLIKQLTAEDYTTEDATFAVDRLDADWNEQAARSAKNYLDFSGFSRPNLLDQLEFDGYTTEQATYGVDKAGL